MLIQKLRIMKTIITKDMKKILTGILVSLFIVTGCNDEELLTPDRAPQQPWDNVGEFEMAVTAAYNKTFYGGWGGRYYMTDRVSMEGMTDVLYMMPATSEDYPQTEVYYRQTEIVNVGRVEGAFGSAYSCINNINSALDFYYNPTNWVENEEEHPFYDLTAANEAI